MYSTTRELGYVQYNQFIRVSTVQPANKGLKYN